MIMKTIYYEMPVAVWNQLMADINSGEAPPRCFQYTWNWQSLEHQRISLDGTKVILEMRAPMLEDGEEEDEDHREIVADLNEMRRNDQVLRWWFRHPKVDEEGNPNANKNSYKSIHTDPEYNAPSEE